jgi:hypothetical protein
VTVGSGSDDGDDFFFDSMARARQRRAEAMVASLGKLNLEPWGTKRDEV